MTSHLALMAIFSLFVSIVFAALTRDEPREQLTFGARLFAGFMGAGILIGWLLCTRCRSEPVSEVRSRRVRTLWLWAPVVAYMVAIFFVSHAQNPPLPAEVSDKTGHIAAYAGLAVVSVRAVGGGLPCRVAASVAGLALAITVGYGAFDEVHQMFVAGRSADVADWYADLAGAAIGIGVCWLWGIMTSRSDV